MRNFSKAIFVVSAFFASLFLVSCGKQRGQVSTLFEKWSEKNDPNRMNASYIYKLSELPMSGQLDRKPWSDYYWPSVGGGIAYRWNDISDSFNYSLYSKLQILQMSIPERYKLSPAEKFDILRGDYTFPLVHKERERTRLVKDHWEGLCHGWASASFNYVEPMFVELINDDGVNIPFASSDVKALLALYNAYYSKSETIILGGRCNNKILENFKIDDIDDCRDINAASFHIVLSNEIGIKKQGFVADLTVYLEVWNHPIYSFTSKIIKEKNEATAGAAFGTVKEIDIETQIIYVIEINPYYISLDDKQPMSTKLYSYRLELDVNDNIIGGVWYSKEHPDFLWRSAKNDTFTGDFELLNKLYKKSQNPFLQVLIT